LSTGPSVVVNGAGTALLPNGQGVVYGHTTSNEDETTALRDAAKPNQEKQKEKRALIISLLTLVLSIPALIGA